MMRRKCNGHDQYALTVVYYRPWYFPFMKRYIIRCWHCNLQIKENSLGRAGKAQA